VVPLLSQVTSERFRDEVHDKMLYKLMYFTFLPGTSASRAGEGGWKGQMDGGKGKGEGGRKEYGEG